MIQERPKPQTNKYDRDLRPRMLSKLDKFLEIRSELALSLAVIKSKFFILLLRRKFTTSGNRLGGKLLEYT
jgi:hypothetical protein